MPQNTLEDTNPPQTARQLKNTGRQDKISLRDCCSATDIDFRDPRDLQRALNSYFAGTSQKTFRARVQASILNAETVTSTLNRHQARDLVDYDPDCGTLLIKKTGRPVHGSAMSWFDLFLSKCREVGFLSAIQRSMITFSTTGFPLPGKLDLGRRKLEARVKYPDYALVFIDPEYRLPRPTIILEVGFTESYSDLLIDMRHWLIKSDEINIVILITIEEDTRTRDEVRRATDFHSRLSAIIDLFGNSAGKNRNADDESESASGDNVSNPERHRSLFNDYIRSEDWVGELSVHLEVWERGFYGPQKRGGRVNVFTTTNEAAIPCLKLGDLFPADKWPAMPNLDPNRQITLDLEMFRGALTRGRAQLACIRALEYIRPAK